MSSTKHRQVAKAKTRWPVPFSIHACASTWIFLGIFLGVTPSIMTYTGYSQHNWGIALLGCLALLALILWLGAFRIAVGDESVSFRSLMDGIENLRYGDIEEVWVTIDLQRGGLGKRAPIRLCLSAKQPTRLPIMINIKVFSADGLMNLMMTLIEKAPQAKFDDPSRDMAEGRMPSVFGSRRKKPVIRGF
jgi:hypothetical protein